MNIAEETCSTYKQWIG